MLISTHVTKSATIWSMTTCIFNPSVVPYSWGGFSAGLWINLCYKHNNCHYFFILPSFFVIFCTDRKSRKILFFSFKSCEGFWNQHFLFFVILVVIICVLFLSFILFLPLFILIYLFHLSLFTGFYYFQWWHLIFPIVCHCSCVFLYCLYY